MYDPQTAQLIASAPALEGLNLETLPQELTRAHAEIVSLRMRLTAGASLEEVGDLLDQLRRLANTYTARVTIANASEDPSAAAYVAASAHQLLHRARSLEANDSPKSYLSRDAISSDVAGCLLFFIAGYPADAVEMAAAITPASTSSVQDALLEAVGLLATGQVGLISSADHALLPQIDDEQPDDLATRVLWVRLLNGVRTLAQHLSGAVPYDEPATSNAVSLFAAVKASAVSPIDLSGLGASTGENEKITETGAIYSMYAGPHLLAALLLKAGLTLLGQALVQLPPPGVDPIPWSKFLAGRARTRPFLWHNHREALNQGFLEAGTSSVISFPTGAGKSTLSELKIYTALLRQKKVVYLVPTHALVSQTVGNFKRSFPDANVRTSIAAEGEYGEVDPTDLPDIAVMTPERCLTFVSNTPGSFHHVGLLVLDECHILHPTRGVRDRRALDAMLSLLQVMDAAPDADVMLLSAMVSNADALAAWIETHLGRPSKGITLAWKPTRQVRGCLVYANSEIESKRAWLASERTKVPPKKRSRVPAANLRRQLEAHPFGLFCLRQTWSTNPSDFKLLPLLDEEVPLSANQWWGLTANKNVVATLLAVRLAELGVKTLVFVQDRRFAEKIAREVALGAPGELELKEEESHLMEVAADELGGASHVLGPFGASAACHHGLLIPVERRLNEGLFARKKGVTVLTATPTLAQGMNLPAEVVLIVGDDRHDADAGRQMLAAHELLNAAGRAGRAGHLGHGTVLVMPNIVTFDEKESKIGEAWLNLQRDVFSKTDQCLEVTDPIESLLDAIESSDASAIDRIRYFLSRLPVEDQEGDQEARKMIDRSLAAFHAEKRGEKDRFNGVVDRALALRRTSQEKHADADWEVEVASKTGIPLATIVPLSELLHQNDSELGGSTLDWIAWFAKWMMASEERANLFTDYAQMLKLLNDKSKPPLSVDDLRARMIDAVCKWMKGSTIAEIEIALGTAPAKLGDCDRARRVVLRLVPDLAYGVGVVAQTHRYYLDREAPLHRMPLSLATAASCLREGFDAPEKLALKYLKPNLLARRQWHAAYEQVADYMPEPDPFEEFSATLSRAKTALKSAPATDS